MNLSNFIRNNIEKILQNWEGHAHAIQPERGSLNREELRDHAETILHNIADGIEKSRSKQFREERSRGLHPLLGKALRSAVEHGVSRHGFGFTINCVLSEYRALRASVMHLCAESEHEAPDRDEIALFNEELDGVIKTAVEAFTVETEKQRRLLDKVITSSRDHCYILNVAGKFIYANESLLKDLDINNSTLMGMTHHELCLPVSDTLHQEAMNVIATGEERDGEVTYSLPSGEEKTYEYLLAPILDDQMVVEGVAALERDITDLRDLIRALEKSNEKLDNFALIMAHDLQAPLRTVTGYLGIIKSDYAEQLDEKGKHYIERSVLATRHMKNLVDSLLSMSRLTSSFELKDSNLNSLVDTVLINLESVLQEKNATVHCANLPTLVVDPVQIQNLFQNFITNAVKYNESSEPTVEIGCQVKSTGYEFFVKDNGIGIPSRFHKRIFMIFQRLHTAEEYEGIGMGLTTCKSIVEGHGGTIWVESSCGKGTTIYFTLPLAQ